MDIWNDIGKKIKSLAVNLSYVGIIGYILTAIIMIFFGLDEDEEAITTWGVIILIAGPLLSIINGFIIYGFGELIDKICIIERNICGEENKFCGEENKSQTEKINKIERLLSKGLITGEEYKEAVSKED